MKSVYLRIDRFSEVQPVSVKSQKDTPSPSLLPSAVASADHYLSYASREPTPDFKNIYKFGNV